jgi:xylose dehydrogenase (NAD/NADP)
VTKPEPVRWGLLSTASINGAILTGARAAAGAEVVAVASRDRARGEAYGEANGIGTVHGSYEALLADDAVEAVYISLPNAMHVPWSVRALEAGKHVLCEKPLSQRAADVEAAFDLAEQQGLLLMEAFMWRYHPQTERLEQMVAGGEIGALRLIRAAFGFDLPEDSGNVRWSRELEGGALMDVGSYCVSALRLLAGEPERVAAEAVEGGDGVDARFAGLLRLPGGVVGTFDCAMDVPRRAGLEVVGETGTLISTDPWHGRAPDLTLLRPDAEPERIPVDAPDPYALELEDFSAAVRGGPSPRLGREDAVGQARTIEALFRAAREGGPVPV